MKMVESTTKNKEMLENLGGGVGFYQSAAMTAEWLFIKRPGLTVGEDANDEIILL